MAKNRRTLKKSRTAKRRQNGGVAPVGYSIPFGQRQPSEAIMERATTAGGGDPNKVHYPLYGKCEELRSQISSAKDEILQEQGEELQKCKTTIPRSGGRKKKYIKRKQTKRNKRN